MQTKLKNCHEISARSSWVFGACESRPDLSGPLSILQSRFNRAQVSDIRETNRVVRLAKAHTDLALLRVMQTEHGKVRGRRDMFQALTR